jgi:hypothetical protein
MEAEVAVAPATLFDLGRLSLEGLTLLYLFSVSYVGEPEAELVAIARNELARRGVLEIVNDTQDIWDLDEETREELAEVFSVHHLLESFQKITAPDSDDDAEESEAS